MSEPSLEQRLVQLEELFTHQQHLVQQLNDVTIRLRTDLDELNTRMSAHEKQINWLNQNSSIVDDHEEKPPHY